MWQDCKVWSGKQGTLLDKITAMFKVSLYWNDLS